MSSREYSEQTRKQLERAFPSKLSSRRLLMDLGYSVFDKVRRRIAEDFGWRCQYCGRQVRVGLNAGRDLATIDHKTPLSRGGTWKRFNLTCACKWCNSLKNNRTAEEFMALPAYLRDAS